MKKCSGLLLGLLLAGSYAQAATFDFNCITNNSGNCGSIEPLFSLDVEASGQGTLFRFNVAGGASAPNAAVKGIFFDDSLNLLDPSKYVFDETGGTLAGGGVDFQPIAAPGKNFPAGNPVGFKTTFSTKAEAPRGDDGNGIDNGEWLGILFENTNTSLILAAIRAFDLRVGIHVGSIGYKGRYSESLVAVPLPAAAWLFGSALIGFFGFTGLRKRTQVSA